MDWQDNRTLALLCGALIQRVIKNDWLRRAFFEIMGRLVCMQTDQKDGLAKWLLLQRITQQLSQEKEKIVFDNKTSIDVNQLLESLKESDFASAARSVETTENPAEQLEQLRYKYNWLENELLQAREALDVLRLEKDAEIEDLKKHVQHTGQQVANVGAGSLVQAEEARYEELQQRRALERQELQEDRQKLEEQKHKLNDEREQLWKLITKLREEGAGIESLEKAKADLSHLVSGSSTTESIDVRIQRQEEDQYKQHVDVIKEWFEGLQIKLTKPNLHEELIDGSVLCQAMNILKPGSIRKYYPQPKVTMLRIENIGFFLNACESEFGFSPFQLFSATDLIDGQNMKKVLFVLIDIMKKISIKDFSEI